VKEGAASLLRTVVFKGEMPQNSKHLSIRMSSETRYLYVSLKFLRYFSLAHKYIHIYIYILLIQPGEEYRPRSYVSKLMLHCVSDEPWKI